MLQTALPLLAWVSIIMALHDALYVAGDFQRLCSFHIPYMPNIRFQVHTESIWFCNPFFFPSIKPRKNNYDNNVRQEAMQQIIYLSNTRNLFYLFSIYYVLNY